MTQQHFIWRAKHTAIAGGHEVLQVNGATSVLTVVILYRKIAPLLVVTVCEGHPTWHCNAHMKFKSSLGSSVSIALVVESTKKNVKRDGILKKVLQSTN